MKVMIVEDELIISLSIAKMLESLGHSVIARVASAEEVFAALENQAPDLILLDIHIEGKMDGIEAAKEIKRRWGTPFAFASAYTDDATKTRAAAVKPVAFIPKPLGLASLRGFLDSFAPAPSI